MTGAVWMVLATAVWAAEPGCADTPPAGWVSLLHLHEGIRVEAKYATADNFTGAPLPGYARADAWLRTEAADALVKVAEGLADQGYGLVVYDAYRPIRATEAMVDWTHRTKQPHLVTDGYIAARSGHNHGHTVDLTLVKRDGTAVDMGSTFDHFGKESHHSAPVGEAAAHHRSVLKAAMQAAGFRAYSKEWWHYRFPLAGTTPMDVALGCQP